MPLPLFNSLSLLATALRIKVHTLSHPVGVAATYLTRLLQCIAAAAKSLQSCPTLCDPIDGSPVPGILQARTLEWAAISFSNAGK